jgi:hypothetical protein
MGGSREDSAELLRRAAAARAAGDAEAARVAYAQAYHDARQSDDVEVMTEAALGLAAGHIFGTDLGRVPALLHEAYTIAEGVARARLAVALARVWVYGGNPSRAVQFATEAVAAADGHGDAVVLAEALDAELLVHWGPDDLAERLRITTRLQDTVAHVADVESRMSAYLWRLTTALECLDAVNVQRQLRALDVLAEESGSARVRFFAASRRGMHALLIGDLSQAAAALETARRAGAEAAEPDTYPIERTLAAGIARQAGDREALRHEAMAYEVFGTSEGVASVAAEAAVLWLAAGSTEHAWSLLHQLAGPDFGTIARDVDWLLTMASLTEVAAGTGAAGLASEAVRLLEPYAGRAVVNGGAVAFGGVVDDYLQQACTSLGRTQEAQRWARTAAAAYHRIGATWWLRRLQAPAPVTAAPTVVQLRPGPDDIWSIGMENCVVTIREMKGLRYLRLLLRQPGVEISSLELSNWVSGLAGAGMPDSDVGEVIDRRAVSAYRRRLTELEEDLSEAESWADQARAAKLRAERDALLDQVRAATGLHGRQRRTGSAGERARVAVRKAVAAAIDRIEQLDPALGRLLRDTVRTGTICRYDPDPARPVRWLLDEP